jgi:Na+-translocating ferredoxin:NAD+ oxidoreductase RnfG subunit
MNKLMRKAVAVMGLMLMGMASVTIAGGMMEEKEAMTKETMKEHQGMEESAMKDTMMEEGMEKEMMEEDMDKTMDEKMHKEQGMTDEMKHKM